ncbi:hypothetical protein N7448_007236 [Penicillium atrosanguineum]|nr:uncharacterized protein N7443_001737 [Penicillium atrosanguineum]KAJ5126457.1 hypothetical protein N7448_007236 [Penicillium atrosanguineum]KAJ5314853.1 hypothetical protein N7443_001737 [Penicillium atrosanguineum]
MKDPAIGFTCLYTSFVYSIYYSFFEAFPLIYTEGYHMSPAQFSLIFLALVVGCGVGAFLYLMYLYYYHPQRHQSANQASSTQESILIPALLGSFLTPTGLFLFAWTARATIHWSIPTIGIVIYSASSFGIYQALLIYIPRSYPKYAASLFAANDLVRSTTAAVFIMVTPYMYNNLGVPKGVALLASVSVLGIVGMAFLYLYGERMRARSRFAT